MAGRARPGRGASRTGLFKSLESLDRDGLHGCPALYAGRISPVCDRLPTEEMQPKRAQNMRFMTKIYSRLMIASL